ncbi:MAG: LysM peptidoglycan-binding domain-containing protein [Anaerolineae bacterium]|nr:LysM peptidoglycan-binding domain-containing protein [Anaerolineae bacterium]
MSGKFQTFLFAALAALLLTASVSQFAFARTDVQDAACQQTYFVQAGDWLSTIAEKYLGDVSAYPALLQATNDAAKSDSSFAAIDDANKIEVGQKLCIPAITTVPGRELAGIYTAVGPAADASALVETLVLGGDLQVRYVMNYIGKAEINATGTWKQDGSTVNVVLTEQAGKPVDQTMTLTVDGANLVSTTPPNTVYTRTAPSMAFYTSVYTSGRSTQDGSKTLTALTLLPNGVAQMTLSTPDNPFILQTGTWTVGPNPDTGAESITVHLTQQGDQTIDETFVFQVQGNLLRGTQYDSDKWGTDLTFTKVPSPSEPSTPANTTPEAEGTPTANVTEVVTTTAAVEATPVVTVTATITATAVVTGTESIDADYGGVTFSFSSDLAQSAQGETTQAVPVSQGPALGGATPASVRFLFNGQKPDDYFSPYEPQVLVYRAEDWVKLDPMTAEQVTSLQTLLTDKPATFPKQIPLLPILNAAQVFNAQTKYLDFDGGSGVGFVTYYAQDVSPVTRDRIFYTFQGLTTDGKYYVAAYWPVQTDTLPATYQEALGTMTDAQWAAQYNTYLQDLVKDLNALAPGDYTPSLTPIEDMIQTIKVSDTTLE